MKKSMYLLFAFLLACSKPENVPASTATALPIPTPRIAPTGTSEPAEFMDESGATMRFVAAGNFMTRGKEGEDELHVKYLPGFYMDKYEVSNAQYRACVDADVCTPPSGTSENGYYYGSAEFDNYPVIFVPWNMAEKYCGTWRSARLPIGDEWEKAARGGSDQRKYPWGDGFDETQANFCDTNCLFAWADKSLDDGYVDIAPVDAFENGISPYGIHNLVGNVDEWVATVEGDYDYHQAFVGGSYKSHSDELIIQQEFPLYLKSYNDSWTGFRCAREAGP